MNEREAQETADIACAAAPRRAQITSQDLGRFGFIAGSPGCRALLSGKSRQGNAEGCRANAGRIERVGWPETPRWCWRGTASLCNLRRLSRRRTGNGAAPRGEPAQESTLAPDPW